MGVDDAPQRDVVMVLGARAHPDRPSALLAARLDTTAELYHAGKVRAILVSGAGVADSNFETDVMTDYLVRRGVPEDVIVADPSGFDTYDSCIRARDVYGVTEMLVVTQEFHIQRAVSICQELGIDSVGIAETDTAELYPLLMIRLRTREQLAYLKMMWDLWTDRTPRVKSAPDPSLKELLEER